MSNDSPCLFDIGVFLIVLVFHVVLCMFPIVLLGLSVRLFSVYCMSIVLCLCLFVICMLLTVLGRAFNYFCLSLFVFWCVSNCFC